MDQSSHPSQPPMGISPGATRLSYPAPPYAQPIVAGAPPVFTAMPSSTHPLSDPFSHQLSYQQVHHQQQQQLHAFWSNQIHEIEQASDFKNYSLPLARIKKIMKADEEVRMISAEVPVLFSKASELFIMELTLRSWMHAEENKRKTLQKNDILAAITRTDIFDFLVDIVPRDELKEEAGDLGISRGPIPGMAPPVDSLQCYYVPAQPQLGVAGMIMGKPVDQATAFGVVPQAQAMGYAWPQHGVQSEQQQQQQMPDGV
ncbi:Nuclear transcription factor Y subunit C-1 [Platanthera guangdongensis]|uniref:Nuclear transcription factor Y subunit C-1 n=1 Tax=Platanthera guangdongensis TaxID=2320717 RepID=A0ABR2LJ75_9ASPA